MVKTLVQIGSTSIQSRAFISAFYSIIGRGLLVNKASTWQLTDMGTVPPFIVFVGLKKKSPKEKRVCLGTE